MKRSVDHILVSHAGNLPRPRYLDELITGFAGHTRPKEISDPAEYAKRLQKGVDEIVARQIDMGIDVVNDGEFAKAGTYDGYIHQRITGFSFVPYDPNRPTKRGGIAERDKRQFPGFYASGLWFSGSGGPVRPGFATPGEVPQSNLAATRICSGPIKYTGQEAIKADIKNLKTALAGKSAEGFVAALGPLSLGNGIRNEHYKSEEEYMMAVADAVREEYKAITDGGFIVQVDEPEFCSSWMFYPEWDVKTYRPWLEAQVEYINYAVRGLPEDQIRFHSCWGSGHRPHVNDIDFKHIADIMLKIKAQQYAIEASNVRHDADYHVWEELKLPDGKMLMPGVIGHFTDLVEHPELVAERLMRYAKLVGRENVQGGTDCGMGSRVGHEEVCWAKFKSLVDGARIATERLWGR